MSKLLFCYTKSIPERAWISVNRSTFYSKNTNFGTDNCFELDSTMELENCSKIQNRLNVLGKRHREHTKPQIKNLLTKKTPKLTSFCIPTSNKFEPLLFKENEETNIKILPSELKGFNLNTFSNINRKSNVSIELVSNTVKLSTCDSLLNHSCNV